MKLQRGTTAAALLAAVLATLAAPGWSETLRLRGYGDYVDLTLLLPSTPGNLTPGAASPLTLRAANAGPGSTQSPVVLLSVDAGVAAEAVTGCLNPARPQRTCLLPEIAPGAAQDATMLLHVDPFTRGTVLVGAAVTSEAVETDPGDEIVVVALPVVPEAETRVTLVDPTPEVLVDGRLAWTVRVDNDGPGAAISPFFSNGSFALDGPVLLECSVDGSAACPQLGNYLGPGSAWFLRLIAPALSTTNTQIILNVAVQPQEFGNDFANDAVFTVYRDELFADGME